MSNKNNNNITEHEDIDSAFEGETMPTSGSPGSDIDGILTDDLLATSEEERNNKKKRQPKKVLTKKKTPAVKRVRKTTQTKLKIPQVQKKKEKENTVAFLKPYSCRWKPGIQQLLKIFQKNTQTSTGNIMPIQILA